MTTTIKIDPPRDRVLDMLATGLNQWPGPEVPKSALMGITGWTWLLFTMSDPAGNFLGREWHCVPDGIYDTSNHKIMASCLTKYRGLVQWDGTFMPEAGMLIDIRVTTATGASDPTRAVFHYLDDSFCIYTPLDQIGGKRYCHARKHVQLFPINTQRRRAVDRMMKLSTWTNNIEGFCDDLYHAGYRQVYEDRFHEIDASTDDGTGPQTIKVPTGEPAEEKLKELTRQALTEFLERAGRPAEPEDIASELHRLGARVLVHPQG